MTDYHDQFWILQNDTDFDEIRKVGELLAEAKKKKAQLREPLSETEIIAALGDISGLWQFMFPGTVINRTLAAGIILPPFCVYSGVSRRLLFLISTPGNYPNY